MLLIVCLESKNPYTEQNIFKTLRLKEDLKNKLGWSDVVFHSFQFARYNEKNIKEKISHSLLTLPHYNDSKKYSRILIILDNDKQDVINSFNIMHPIIEIALKNQFPNCKDEVHKVNIPFGESIEYFISLFFKNKQINLENSIWEDRKK